MSLGGLGGLGSEDVAPFLWVDDEVVADEPAAPRGGDDAPGEAGLWVFVLGDMTVFVLIFAVLLVERGADHARFAEAARHLLLPIGLANTLVLLTSSYAVARALNAHRRDERRRCRGLLAGATALAAVFAVLKVAEWSVEIGGGLLAAGGTFVVLYFALTGLHLLHVLVGAAVLLRWRVLAGRELPWPRVRRFAESGAVYWHLVDLLWLLIFSVVYLVAAG